MWRLSFLDSREEREREREREKRESVAPVGCLLAKERRIMPEESRKKKPRLNDDGEEREAQPSLATEVVGGDIANGYEDDVSTLIEHNGKRCTHITVWPEGMTPRRVGPPPPVTNYAKEYAFELDPFQVRTRRRTRRRRNIHLVINRFSEFSNAVIDNVVVGFLDFLFLFSRQSTSVNCIEQGESVMVAAHTSAGKTVVAEYAIAMALRDGQRVVYTSPLKALSNQKFRELSDTFDDVGLMTGDVTINPNASCLVMTTEILRSMLYRGSDVAIEVAWIIFDEIHYLRDKERGVVWEETIILVPDRVHFVFLSATLPNAKEFAGWIAKTHRQPCHLVSTDYRPTPLQHYLFPAGASGLYMVVDEKSKFKPDNFQKAIAELGGDERETELVRKEKNKRNQEDILKIVQLIMERKFDPCIVFAFSKRDCENLAMKLTNLDLTTDDEKKLINIIFTNAVDCLSNEDKRLPQIKHILPLLKQGIGIHHSGLLPILKEVVEILFQEGLLKCLFATETFSTGLNMPAKTVVFVRPRKFDGGGFRWLSSGEYIQMSGRAGRRGLDDKGIVILMLDSKMEPAVAREMVQGSADPLVSAFHLSFNMILNLCRTESGDPEALMKSSYRQYQTELALPNLKKKVKELKERSKFVIEGEAKLEESFVVLQKIGQLHAERRMLLQNPDIILPFLQPGRLVKVLCHDALDMEKYLNSKEYSLQHSCEEEDIEVEAKNLVDRVTKWSKSVWGAVVNFKKVSSRSGPKFQVDVLVGTGGGKESTFSLQKSTCEDAKPKVVTFDLARVDHVSKVRMYLPADLRSLHSRQQLLGAICEVEKRFGADAIPLLDPEEDMKLDSKEYRKIARKLETLEDLVQEKEHAKEHLHEGFKLLCKKSILKSMADAAKRESIASTSLVGKEELRARRRMLRKLDYVNSSQIVQTKGHLAAEISSADELVLTELLVNGTFKNLPHDQTVAILSCFVHSEKSKSTFNSESTSLLEEHFQLFSKLREQVRRIASVAKDVRLGIDLEKYLDSFSPQLMEAAAAWTKGSNFANILKISKVFEGSLVRAIRRVDELLQQLIAACNSIGENEQADHFSQCSEQIKKDVVFAASLYL